jgi:hypothetical protein
VPQHFWCFVFPNGSDEHIFMCTLFI